MATTYATPGVYVEWFDQSPRLIEPRRMDVAGFVGIAERGPLHEPVKIESVRQFRTTFGDALPEAYLAFAIAGFFANGGRTAWVVRVGDARTARPARIDLELGPNGGSLALEATSPGRWGNDVRIDQVFAADRRVRLVAREPGDHPPQTIVVAAPSRDAITVTSAAAAPAADDLVRVVAPAPSATAATFSASKRSLRLAGGSEGLDQLSVEEFIGGAADARPRGFAALALVDEVSILVAPDLLRATRSEDTGRGRTLAGVVAEAQAKGASGAERRGDRLILYDVPAQPPTRVTPLKAREHRELVGATSFAALYYPWLIVSDPLGPDGAVRAIPASGHVAGIYARSARHRGVQKPPANEVIEGALDVSETIDERAHGELNDAGVNAIRPIPGRGVLVLGARTLALGGDPVRFVNARRLLSMLRETVDRQMQWVVFEPNQTRLRSDIERSVSGLLEGLYRAGALDGATSEDAYYVRCDATTNTPTDVELGRVICLVGLRLPPPAEFVVVRIGVTKNGIEIEEKGGHDV